MTAIFPASSPWPPSSWPRTFLCNSSFGEWLTWGAFTYPFAFLVTDVMNRLYGAATARKVVLAGFVDGVICSLHRHPDHGRIRPPRDPPHRASARAWPSWSRNWSTSFNLRPAARQALVARAPHLHPCRFNPRHRALLHHRLLGHRLGPSSHRPQRPCPGQRNRADPLGRRR